MMDRPYAFKSKEKRLQMLEQRFRQHHVDIQRLWKRLPGPDEPGYFATSIQNPTDFDEPPDESTGGTTHTGTACKNRYCVSRYAGNTYQLAGGGLVSWSAVSAAEDPPDSAGAIVSLTAANSTSYHLLSEEFNFNIPVDAVPVSIKLYVRCKASEPNKLIGVSANRYVHLNSTYLTAFSTPALPIMILHNDWLERIFGQLNQTELTIYGITPEIINSAEFGAAFALSANETVAGHIDAIRLEICYDAYTLSGTCSENPG